MPGTPPEKAHGKLLAARGARTPTCVTTATGIPPHPADQVPREEIDHEQARPGIRTGGQCPDGRDGDHLAAVARTRPASIPGSHGQHVRWRRRHLGCHRARRARAAQCGIGERARAAAHGERNRQPVQAVQRRGQAGWPAVHPPSPRGAGQLAPAGGTVASSPVPGGHSLPSPAAAMDDPWASYRVATLSLWLSDWTPPARPPRQNCSAGVCAAGGGGWGGPDFQINGDRFNVGPVLLQIRRNGGTVLWSTTVSRRPRRPPRRHRPP